jgi:hypothetical protein
LAGIGIALGWIFSHRFSVHDRSSDRNAHPEYGVPADFDLPRDFLHAGDPAIVCFDSPDVRENVTLFSSAIYFFIHSEFCAAKHGKVSWCRSVTSDYQKALRVPSQSAQIRALKRRDFKSRLFHRS